MAQVGVPFCVHFGPGVNVVVPPGSKTGGPPQPPKNTSSTSQPPKNAPGASQPPKGSQTAPGNQASKIPQASKGAQAPVGNQVQKNFPPPQFSAVPQPFDDQHAEGLPLNLFQLGKKLQQSVRDRAAGGQEVYCPLCVAYGFWGRYEIPSREHLLSSYFPLCDSRSYDYGQNAIAAAAEHETFTLTPSSDAKDYSQTVLKLPVKASITGETYHALVCSMLHPDKTQVFYDDESKNSNFDRRTLQSKSAEQQAFLEFYNVETTKPTGTGAAMHEASELIAAVFRQSASNKLDNKEFQESKFAYINRKLKGPNLQTEDEHIDPKYISVTYIAKYWLNRFIKLTQQRPSNKGNNNNAPSSKKEEPASATRWLGLPKPGGNTRVAVIVVRVNAANQLGKIMNRDNALSCIRAVVAANKLAKLYPKQAQPFTHLIFYGDLDMPTGRELASQVKEIEKEDKSATPQLEMLFITEPWNRAMPIPSNNEKDNQMAQQIYSFWQSFRGESDFFGPNPNSKIHDNLPLRAKEYAIFGALIERYGENLSFIGFRSGFLEGAALLGAPYFYLNDVTLKNRPKLSEDVKNGRSLWDAKFIRDHINPDNVRLLESGEVMSTFVSIDFDSDKLKSPYTIEWNTRRLLCAALFVYMCTNRLEKGETFDGLTSPDQGSSSSKVAVAKPSNSKILDGKSSQNTVKPTENIKVSNSNAGKDAGKPAVNKPASSFTDVNKTTETTTVSKVPTGATNNKISSTDSDRMATTSSSTKPFEDANKNKPPQQTVSANKVPLLRDRVRLMRASIDAPEGTQTELQRRFALCFKDMVDAGPIRSVLQLNLEELNVKKMNKL